MITAAKQHDAAITTALSESKKYPGGVLAKVAEGAQAHAAIGTGMSAWKDFRAEKRRDLESKFSGFLSDCEDIAGGLRTKGSWKATLNDDSPDDEVKECGKVLTSGPGGQVLALKDKIAEDRPCPLTSTPP